MYIKINGKTKHYNVTVEPFTTQHGKKAIRFVGGNIPETDKGFKYYDDNGVEVLDLSDYVYIYRDNEYSTEQDTMVLPSGNPKSLGPSAYDRLNARINSVNARVTDITPYTVSKTAYIDDTEVLFDIAKEGNISVFMVDNEGQNVPHTFEQINGQVRVSFEKRETLATVTISIQ